MADIDTIRAKIAARIPTERCDPQCPTWCVFDTGTLRVGLDICYDCWSGIRDPLSREELEELPEAQCELALAQQHKENYVHPVAGPLCKCGGNFHLWRLDATNHLRCVSCRHAIVTLGGTLESYLNARNLTLMAGCRSGQWWARVVKDGDRVSRPDGPGTHASMLAAIHSAIADWETKHS